MVMVAQHASVLISSPRHPNPSFLPSPPLATSDARGKEGPSRERISPPTATETTRALPASAGSLPVTVGGAGAAVPTGSAGLSASDPIRYRPAVASFWGPSAVIDSDIWGTWTAHQVATSEHLVPGGLPLQEFCLRNFSVRFPWIMGAFCSCLQPDYSDHHGNHTSSPFRNCMCLRCFTQQLINAYTVLFRAGSVHSVAQAIEATPVDSTESSFDTYRSPPRPLPYDDPRFSPPARDWLRRETPSHSPEESEPLRANDDDEEIDTPSRVDKASKTNYDTKMKICSSAYGDKVPPKELGSYFSYFSPSAEDEDVCPTCLEDYTSENPRIVMQCSHHFHLGCIYEWMERSEACPVCGKKMEFDEST